MINVSNNINALILILRYYVLVGKTIKNRRISDIEILAPVRVSFVAGVDLVVSCLKKKKNICGVVYSFTLFTSSKMMRDFSLKLFFFFSNSEFKP